MFSLSFQSLIPTLYSRHFSVVQAARDSSSPRGDSLGITREVEGDSQADSPFNSVDINDYIRTLYFIII